MYIREQFDNSFFHQDYSGMSVLVFVPHQDDEINTAGSLIYALTQNEAKVTLVYTTNGDWKYPAKTRFKEAVAAAHILGIDRNDILFLGYGDSISNTKHDHLFYAVETPFLSTAGHKETYGDGQYCDYSYVKNGTHHIYTSDNYLRDIIAVIEDVRADFIICIDFDEHPDHRMLSLYFDRAMGIVRKQNPLYCPKVWKSFAYSLAYTAEADYCRINNHETKRPTCETTEKYELDLIGMSIYQWHTRIRIPVPLNENDNIYNNIIAEALRKHRSQRIIARADRIINSDEVFWERRTDSISYIAKITASSGKADYLQDFMLYNVDDVDDVTPSFADYYWRPDDIDTRKEAIFTWDEQQNIQRVVLYSRIDSDSSIKRLSISFDDGTIYYVNDVPNNGNPCVVEVGIHKSVKECVLTIIETIGNNYGLSECEFYNSNHYCGGIKPYCKILIKDNFVYDYYIDTSVSRLPIDVYLSKNDGKVKLEVISGKSKIIDGDLVFEAEDKEITLRCSVNNNKCWDQVVIHRLSYLEMKRLTSKVQKDKRYFRKQRLILKFHNMLYILRHQGIVKVIKRTYNNVIVPLLK